MLLRLQESEPDTVLLSSSFDQRSFDRIVEKSADIGAFESDDIFGGGFNP